MLGLVSPLFNVQDFPHPHWVLAILFRGLNPDSGLRAGSHIPSAHLPAMFPGEDFEKQDGLPQRQWLLLSAGVDIVALKGGLHVAVWRLLDHIGHPSAGRGRGKYWPERRRATGNVENFGLSMDNIALEHWISLLGG